MRLPTYRASCVPQGWRKRSRERACPHFTPGAPELCPLLLPNVNLWSPKGESICPRPNVKGCFLLDLTFPQHLPLSRPFPSRPLRPTHPVAFKGTQHFSTGQGTRGKILCTGGASLEKDMAVESPSPQPSPGLASQATSTGQQGHRGSNCLCSGPSSTSPGKNACGTSITMVTSSFPDSAHSIRSQPPSSDLQAAPLSLICSHCSSLSAPRSSTPH